MFSGDSLYVFLDFQSSSGVNEGKQQFVEARFTLLNTHTHTHMVSHSPGFNFIVIFIVLSVDSPAASFVR